MHAGKLDVLGDGVALDFSVTGYGVNFHFLRTLQELGGDHGMLLAHHHGIFQGAFQFLAAGDHFHGGAGEHVGRTDHDGKAHFIGKSVDVLYAGEFLPAGLVNAQGVAHAGEFLAVLGHVDGLGAGSEDADALCVQFEGQVVGDLAAGRDNHAEGPFHVADIQHAFQRQLVKEQAVAHVVVGAHGLGVVVDHDGAVAHLLDFLHGCYAAPVKLHAGADAVGAAAQHNHGLHVLLALDVVFGTVVGKVQVVGGGGVLAGHGIDLLYTGTDAQRKTLFSHLKPAGMAVRAGRAGNKAAYLPVGEAQTFGSEEGLGVQIVHLLHSLQPGTVAENVLQAEEEPLVNLGNFMDAVDGIAFLEGFHDGQDALVGRVRELGVDIGDVNAVAKEAVQALANHPEALLDGFLEGSANSHHFAHGLHGRAQLAGHAFEFSEVPAGDLAHDIVQRRLKAGRCHLGHGVGHFVQAFSQAQLGGHEGQRIAGGFGGQGR